jgi:hypothetical protein
VSVITQLYIYPIKSCRGIARETLEVSPAGVMDDRTFMLVDDAGKFISARTEPRLLLVRLEEHSDGFIARAPDGAELELSRRHTYSEDCVAQVWNDTTNALQHREGSDYFSTFLGRSVRLVYLPPDRYRQVDPRRARLGDHVAFADAYPLLLISEASLGELNTRLIRAGESPVTMDRFRPNVVIDGGSAHEEDALGDFQVADVALSMPKLCDRCVMTTHNPLTAESSVEPLRTLAKYRKWDGKVWFGANVLVRGSGFLRIGQPLRT